MNIVNFIYDMFVDIFFTYFACTRIYCSDVGIYAYFPSSASTEQAAIYNLCVCVMLYPQSVHDLYVCLWNATVGQGGKLAHSCGGTNDCDCVWCVYTMCVIS